MNAEAGWQVQNLPSRFRELPQGCTYACALLDTLLTSKALNFFIRRDLRRAALFRWIMPFDATRSSVRVAVRTASSAAP